MNRKTLSAFALYWTLASANPAQATTVERLDLEKMVKRSQSIIAGTVTGMRTYWTGGGKLILTDYTIEVDESIKGATKRTIAITTIGGKIGDIELHVSGMPSFQKGETAVVFIETAGTFQTVLGLEQGKFTISNNEVSNSVSGLSFPDGRPGNSLKMPLQTLKARIRTFLSKP